MKDIEQARLIANSYDGDNISTEDVMTACMGMARWKDEQLESKLMQIIILAQQGYTSGATDEMILEHCKEIINENYESF